MGVGAEQDPAKPGQQRGSSRVVVGLRALAVVLDVTSTGLAALNGEASVAVITTKVFARLLNATADRFGAQKRG